MKHIKDINEMNLSEYEQNVKKYLKITASKKNKIRENRTNGLKKYDLVVQKFGAQNVIDEAIQLYKLDHDKKKNNATEYYLKNSGWNDWCYFHYDCFLKIVREKIELINPKWFEVPISFNLDEALSQEELEYISKECGIPLSIYDDSWPRDIKQIRTPNGPGYVDYVRSSGLSHVKTNG